MSPQVRPTDAPGPVKVKICGITNADDALCAVRSGADALGFVFATSPRRVDAERVDEIARRVGPFVSLVGVFVNAAIKEVLGIASRCRLDVLQLHGEESPEYCLSLRPYKIIKTFRVDNLFSLKKTQKYPVDAFLFETSDILPGGSGKTWDWSRLDIQNIKLPYVVGGGLNVNNVRRAVEQLRPYAVDVCSGVEAAKGKKDHALLERFIRYAKEKRTR